jgi:hypothetical protein
MVNGQSKQGRIEMVIRRIREHVVTHNWFAVGVDFLIVVVGVFIATQADNWNETRSKLVHAAESRREIIDDLKGNETDFASRMAYYKTARRHALAALDAIEQPGRSRDASFLGDAYQASQVWTRPSVRSGYDEMAGAGLTHLVGNRETRLRLINYYTQIRQFEVTALGMTAYRDRLRRAMPYEVQMAVREQCGERVIYLADGSQLAALPERCTLNLDSNMISTALARLKAANLGEDLTRHIADLDQKLAGFERFARVARNLRSHLESIDKA